MKALIATLTLAFTIIGCTNTNVDQDHNKQCKENCNVISDTPSSIIVKPVEVEERIEIQERIIEVPVYIDRETGEKLPGKQCRIVYITKSTRIRLGNILGLTTEPYGGSEPSFYEVIRKVSGNGNGRAGHGDPLRYCPTTGELTAGGIIFAIEPS